MMKRVDNSDTYHSDARGFTIVELLIVIVVIAILATVVVVAYKGVTQRAVEASMHTDLESASKAIAILKAGHKNYPNDANAANDGQGLKVTGKNKIYYAGSGSTYAALVMNPDTDKRFCLTNGQIGGCAGGFVMTLAGGVRVWGNPTVDGTGTNATFDWAEGIAFGPDGNLYVGDCTSAVRKVTPAGVVTTFAGQLNMWGYANGPAASALYNCPAGIAVAQNGTVYTSEQNGSFYGVRKVSGGTVSVVAGSATQGYLDGAGAAAQFGNVWGLALDSAGNVYVADNGIGTYDNTAGAWVYSFSGIRKIAPNGNVTTFAGAGSGFADGTGTAARFNYVTGIAVDKNNNLYVTDSNNNRIRKITPAGVVTTIAGSTSGFTDGTGTAAKFDYPTGIAVDKDNNLFVTDSDNASIRKITPAGVVTTIAGSGSYGYADGIGTAAKFDWIEDGIAVDADGAVYVMDSGNYRIRKIIP